MADAYFDLEHLLCCEYTDLTVEPYEVFSFPEEYYHIAAAQLQHHFDAHKRALNNNIEEIRRIQGKIWWRKGQTPKEEQAGGFSQAFGRALDSFTGGHSP